MANIKFTNSVMLDRSSVAGIDAIDTDNLLASGNLTTTPFAITGDGILHTATTYEYFRLDGVQLIPSYAYPVVPVKKGQMVSVSTSSFAYKLYGLKK